MAEIGLHLIFVQIVTGRDQELYGLTSSGLVYRYDTNHEAWFPLENEAHDTDTCDRCALVRSLRKGGQR